MRSWLQANLMNFLSSSCNENRRQYSTKAKCSHITRLILLVKNSPKHARNTAHVYLSPSAPLDTLCAAIEFDTIRVGLVQCQEGVAT